MNPVTKQAPIFLATPYTCYPQGREKAFIDACKVAGWFYSQGTVVYCPVVHSYPIWMRCPKLRDNHETVLPLKIPFIHACSHMVVAEMDGWKESKGIAWEIDYFLSLEKMVEYWVPPAGLI